ncbi:MAG TPA: hypothetical protein VMM15_00355, partial [Bradyrhizobium sp.]|nr:hypothetical protein [Bradyrhizobium sp.]
MGILMLARPTLAAEQLERSVDITSRFLNLSFEGVTETRDGWFSCSYKIPILTIRFARQQGLAT